MFDFSMLSMLTMSIRYGSALLTLRLQDLLRNPAGLMKDTSGLIEKLKEAIDRISPAGVSLSVAAFFFTPSIALAPLLSTYAMICLGAGIAYGVVMCLACGLACYQDDEGPFTLGENLLRWTVNIVEFCAVSGIAMLLLFGAGQLLMAYSSWQLATVLSVAYIATFAVLLIAEFIVDTPGILKGLIPESAERIANHATHSLITGMRHDSATNPRVDATI